MAMRGATATFDGNASGQVCRHVCTMSQFGFGVSAIRPHRPIHAGFCGLVRTMPGRSQWGLIGALILARALNRRRRATAGCVAADGVRSQSDLCTKCPEPR